MNPKPSHPSFVPPASRGWLLVLIVILIGALPPTAPAQTLWTGPTIYFEQSSTNLVDTLIPGAVSFTRAYDMWLFNPDNGDSGPGTNTPSDTLWAFGVIQNYQALSYATFSSYRDGYLQGLLVGNPMVVWLTNQNIYVSVTFSNWPSKGGFFSYVRSTQPPLSATITNPVSGAVFAAPARVTISADTASLIGSVTNVAFFANGNPLGSVSSPPFVLTTTLLAATNYALTAVATAAGTHATSVAENITVISPTPVSLSSSSTANGQFTFNYSADPGLTYVVQSSSNLVDWLSLSTNVADGNPQSFTDNFNPPAYYRVLRLPNP